MHKGAPEEDSLADAKGWVSGDISFNWLGKTTSSTNFQWVYEFILTATYLCNEYSLVGRFLQESTSAKDVEINPY